MSVLVGDCVERMRELDAGSVDAIVTDPPYGLEFMGKDWDRLSDDLPRHGTGESNLNAPDPGPWGRRQRVNFGGQQNRMKRCERCGKREFSGSPCVCADPVWVIETPARAPTSMLRMQRWHEVWAREALRVLKPGGHLLAFGGTRTFHRLACAVEDAGFEVRDCLMWLYGSGFPKSLDVSKAIDRDAGVDVAADGWEPTTDAAQEHAGWGTALKPAWEPIVVARKPLAGTVAGNVLEHGTGAVNVDACRIAHDGRGVWGDHGQNPANHEAQPGSDGTTMGTGWARPGSERNDAGRWPANVVLSHSEDCVQVGVERVRANGHFPSSRGASGYGSAVADSSGGGLKGQEGLEERRFDGESVGVWACVPGCPVRMLDDQTGTLTSGVGAVKRTSGMGYSSGSMAGRESRAAGTPNVEYGDSGGASRFFYCAKASRAERSAGLDGFERRPLEWSNGTENPGSFQRDGTERHSRNPHPTVKPIDLMRWLVRLVTPAGGLISDPFAGSGTTGCAAALEGFEFVGIERDPEYVPIAEARIRFWREHPTGLPIEQALAADTARRRVRETGQGGLFDG